MIKTKIIIIILWNKWVKINRLRYKIIIIIKIEQIHQRRRLYYRDNKDKIHYYQQLDNMILNNQ
jgi:hypothetical protein